MTPNPALQQLKDIHLPQAIQMWPTAPGWLVIYCCIAILLGYGIYFLYQRKKQRYSIHYALHQLNELQALVENNPENINIAAEISTLIRRVALYYFERETIAGLSGENWLRFLNDSSHTTEFTTAAGQLLIDAPYRKSNDVELAPLFVLTENWLATIAKLKRGKS